MQGRDRERDRDIEDERDSSHTEILRSLGVRSEVDVGCAGLTLKLLGKKF